MCPAWVPSTGSTAGRTSHLSQLFCDLRIGLLFFGVLTDPSVILAVLQVCKREYSYISSGEVVRFIARSPPECVWDHLCSSAFGLEKIRRRITVCNKRRKSFSYQKKKKELPLFSLAKWRLEVMQLLSMKMMVGRTRVFWKQNHMRIEDLSMGQEQNQAKKGKVSPHHYSRQGRAFQTIHSSSKMKLVVDMEQFHTVWCQWQTSITRNSIPLYIWLLKLL